MVGLNRAQLAARHERDIKKWREYNAIMKPKWEKLWAEFNERQRTIAILMGAVWEEDGRYFFKIETDEKEQYWDYRGEPIAAYERGEQVYRKIFFTP